jgi:hypothetical protein
MAFSFLPFRPKFWQQKKQEWSIPCPIGRVKAIPAIFVGIFGKTKNRTKLFRLKSSEANFGRRYITCVQSAA